MRDFVDATVPRRAFLTTSGLLLGAVAATGGPSVYKTMVREAVGFHPESLHWI